MIDEEERFKRFGYYSTDLKPKSNKKIVAICDGCGEIRTPSKQNYSKNCLVCAGKSRRGESNSRWKGGKIERICKYCGKKFHIKPSRIKRVGVFSALMNVFLCHDKEEY